MAFSLIVNGQTFTIDTSDPACPYTPSTTLNEFLRHHTPFHGTRVGCNEGGCGACAVSLTYNDATTQRVMTRAINSCLAPLLSLNGLSVTTNEGTATGTHQAIQQTLAAYNGTQCGYCSSGMVMSLYSMLKDRTTTPTKFEIEQMLDGNLCRCTGYRPILEAFKTFGSASLPAGSGCNKEKCCKKLAGRPIEIEDAARTLEEADGPAPPMAEPPRPQVRVTKRRGARAEAASAVWIDVDSETTLQYWLKHYAQQKVMLVVGATSQALYKVDYDVYLNVHDVPTFTTITQNGTGVTFGAAVQFTDLINFLTTCEPTVTGGAAHFPQVVAHLHRVASTLIRNRASVVGNLVLTHGHQTAGNAFPSDACIVLMGVGAQVTLYDVTAATSTTVSMTDFFATSLTGKYVQSVTIPWAAANETFKSYKIAIRQTLDHAMVNGAMRAAVDPTTNKVVGTPTIAIGGVFPVPTRLTAVETSLTGVDVTSASSLQTVLAAFQTAVSTGVDPGPGRVAYRQQVALNYFYKFMLSLQPSLPSDLAAAADVWLKRKETTSSQTFGPPVASERPASEAIPKVDGLAQTSGTAQYTADIPAPAGCLYGALVLTDRANVTITAVDTSAAAAVPGFVRYIDASTLPGFSNDWMLVEPYFIAPGTTSSHAGLFVGLVLAESQTIARHCASLVEAGVTYSVPLGPLVLTVAAAKEGWPNALPVEVKRSTPNTPAADKTVTGTIEIGSQYHFHLENHAVLAEIVEGQIVIDVAAQALVMVQLCVSMALGVPQSDVLVRTRRCGGGYGGKITSPAKLSAITALAAKVTSRPVRLDLPFKDSMRCFGGRPEYELTYSMGVTTAGKIVSLDASVANAVGTASLPDMGEAQSCAGNLDNCYYIPNFNVTVTQYPSSTAPATSVRGPGWIQGIAMSELMMNNAAQQLGMSPDAFKSNNFYVDGQLTPNSTFMRGTQVGTLWAQLYPIFQQLQQQAQAFNKSSRFVKQGVSISPSRFGVSWGGPFNALVAIHPDGTISITHGGVEIGQGINTKVAQACASVFGLTADDVKKHIRVQVNNTAVCPNPGNVTGGSITSEECSMAVMRACEVLRARIQPYYTSDQLWTSAIAAASGAGVELTATGLGSTTRTQSGSRYNSFGCAVSLVEVDTLTGQFEIKRSDLLFDCGVSLNPAIDVGQVEGGFMFGVGWFTSEEVKWDPTTGYAEMAGSWRYKPPGAYDLPETLNVTLLDNSFNKMGVLNSKAVGEPPLALAVSVVQALESAINASRADVGLGPTVVQTTPLTVDKVQVACGLIPSDLTIS